MDNCMYCYMGYHASIGKPEKLANGQFAHLFCERERKFQDHGDKIKQYSVCHDVLVNLCSMPRTELVKESINMLVSILPGEFIPSAIKDACRSR